MLTEHRANKNAIRAFMQNHYTDERLAQLLAHAEDEKLLFNSCCCFIGITTADHPLRSEMTMEDIDNHLIAHLFRAREIDAAREAEDAFGELPGNADGNQDAIRRRILIPMIRAEMRRRDRLSALKPLAAAIVREHVEANRVE